VKIEISPQDTTRAQAFELWMSSPMPMVTLVKIVDVTKALKYCKKHKMSFNMLLCWCIGKAASQIESSLRFRSKGNYIGMTNLPSM
jgi:chloramphenicol O-acetyltransferase type A